MVKYQFREKVHFKAPVIFASFWGLNSIKVFSRSNNDGVMDQIFLQ